MPKKSPPSFAEAMEELEAITAWFEGSAFVVDDALLKFERGLQLAQLCQQRLQEVETKITELSTRYAPSSSDRL
jgi:exodeoxyribonuclease VII small subunit